MVKVESVSIGEHISANDGRQDMIRLRQELWILEIGPLLVGHASIRIKEIENLLCGITLD
jgi:hypothetical protein